MNPHTELLEILGIQGDVEHLEEALTHASFVNENPGARDYQRLEFLGDAVLGLCVSELLLERYPRAKEGKLTRMRAALVNTNALATFARSHHITQFVRVGRGAVESGDATAAKVLADVVEAIIAAVFLAQGMGHARAVTQLIVDTLVDQTSDISERDPKSKLQEIVQRDGGQPPRYETVSVDGPDHDRYFEVEVWVHGQAVARGRGRAKKQAECEAAQRALDDMASPTEDSE